MAFQKSSSAEAFLNSLAVSYEYSEAIKYNKLEPEWGNYNLGRPDNMTHIETAIEAYAAQGVQGSPFPAVIVRSVDMGLEVLDGFQRLSANSLIGNTTFAAYVVDCHYKTGQKIRLAANIRINGTAPVDADWTLKQLVRMFIMESNDSAEDIAQLIGRPVRDVKKEHERQKAVQRVHAAFQAEGKESPAFTETVYDTIANVSQVSDFQRGPREPVVSFLSTLSECRLKNGDNKRWIEHVFGIKRIGNKDRTTQFRSKVREFFQDPIVSRKRSGKPSIDAITNIHSAMQSLHTRVKAYRKRKHASLADAHVAEKWDDTLEETCRWLRELCTTEVRRDVNPFIYGK